MPPVLRYASGPIEAPADLPRSARFALGYMLDEAEGLWHEDELETIRALRDLEPHGDEANAIELRTYDGALLSAIRNLLDLTVLNGTEDCYGLALAFGLEPPPANVMCFECIECKCLVVRDRFDHWFDKAGVRKSAYIADIGPEIEPLWLRVWDGDASWFEQQETTGRERKRVPDREGDDG